jgi:hypothetical protein
MQSMLYRLTTILGKLGLTDAKNLKKLCTVRTTVPWKIFSMMDASQTCVILGPTFALVDYLLAVGGDWAVFSMLLRHSINFSHGV